MSKVGAIITKEVRSYLNTPIAYIAVLFFIVFSTVWFFFFHQFFARDMATLRGYFSTMPLIFIGIIPALTMRIWAEERKMNTDEILMTLPYKERQLVVGKYLSQVILLAVALALTIPVPLTVAPLGNFEAGEIVGEYLGIFLLGGAGIAVGQFVSSIAKNQISAYIFSVIAFLFFTLIGQVNLIADLPSGFGNLINYISLDYHFTSFEKGLIDTRDLGYFLLMIFFFLTLNTQTLKSRKWK